MSVVVSAPPHIKEGASAKKMVWDVIIALLPAVAASVHFFGLQALTIISTSVLAAVCTEGIIQKMRLKKVTITDGSAVVTGLLLALLLPSNVPLWVPIVGAFVAVAIAKHAFGGYGSNIFNPALVGWAFLTMAWPMHMAMDVARLADIPPVVLLVCAVFLFLLNRGYIKWQISAAYLITTVSLMALFTIDISRIFIGIFILGVFFMATDPVTTPVTKKGRFVFGIGCGILTVIYGLYGSYAEGVGYSILLMNSVTPLIDRFTRPKPLREDKP